jgi:hypothetical protein
MLKLNAGFSRKVGEPNYGSRGASVNVELELESGLVGDADGLMNRIRSLFSIAKRAEAEQQWTVAKNGYADALKSVMERNLSTNGSAGANGSSADWFKFTIDTDQPAPAGVHRCHLCALRITQQNRQAVSHHDGTGQAGHAGVGNIGGQSVGGVGIQQNALVRPRHERHRVVPAILRLYSSNHVADTFVSGERQEVWEGDAIEEDGVGSLVAHHRRDDREQPECVRAGEGTNQRRRHLGLVGEQEYRRARAGGQCLDRRADRRGLALSPRVIVNQCDGESVQGRSHGIGMVTGDDLDWCQP